MTWSSIFALIGISLSIVGCFFEVVISLNQKNSEVYTSTLFGGFLEKNIKNAFLQKYMQILGFSYIMIGGIFQALPIVYDFSKKEIFSKDCILLLEMNFIIIISAISFLIMVLIAKRKYFNETNRRENIKK